jgi:hypothetical protein
LLHPLFFAISGSFQASAEADLRDLIMINKAAAKYWQAAAWYLERSDPKHWGRRVVIDKERERKPKAPKVIGFNRPGVPDGAAR